MRPGDGRCHRGLSQRGEPSFRVPERIDPSQEAPLHQLLCEAAQMYPPRDPLLWQGLKGNQRNRPHFGRRSAPVPRLETSTPGRVRSKVVLKKNRRPHSSQRGECWLQKDVASGSTSKSVSPPVNIRFNPTTTIGPKMGGEFTYTKMGSQNGVHPRPSNQGRKCGRLGSVPLLSIQPPQAAFSQKRPMPTVFIYTFLQWQSTTQTH